MALIAIAALLGYETVREDVSGLIAHRCEAWAYPPLFPDIAAKLDTGCVQTGDPALDSLALWPEGARANG
jgi:hypothetical protein